MIIRTFLAMVFALFTGMASAASIDVTGITASWGNVQGTANRIAGQGTASINWGDPATNSGPSGYDFIARALPFLLILHSYHL